MYATNAEKLVAVKSSKPSKRAGASNVSLVRSATKRWTIGNPNSRAISVHSALQRGFSSRTKFYEFDMKPTCKRCYDRFPTELKKRISDSLKDRDIENQRRRSLSPAAMRQV